VHVIAAASGDGMGCPSSALLVAPSRAGMEEDGRKPKRGAPLAGGATQCRTFAAGPMPLALTRPAPRAVRRHESRLRARRLALAGAPQSTLAVLRRDTPARGIHV